MHLSRIRIVNFRNFSELDVALNGNVVVVGENRMARATCSTLCASFSTRHCQIALASLAFQISGMASTAHRPKTRSSCPLRYRNSRIISMCSPS
jgi:hypothetical protein